MSDQSPLEDRIAELERRLRRDRLILCILATVTGGAVLMGWAPQESRFGTIRVKAIIVEDVQGRERIVIGAPIPEPPGARIAPSTGMAIRDTNGYERFGLGLFPNGRMGMGFDAPPGKGDDRNRERINIIADPEGGANIRFLNRKTRPAGYLSLDRDDMFYIDFLDFPEGKMIQRRIGLRVDSTRTEPLPR